jgi:hypothetical protein
MFYAENCLLIIINVYILAKIFQKDPQQVFGTEQEVTNIVTVKTTNSTQAEDETETEIEVKKIIMYVMYILIYKL